MRSFSLWVVITLWLFGMDIAPTFSYKASGGVTDMLYSEGKIFVATQASRVDIFDTTTHQKLPSTIFVPKIKDFVGDEMESKIYSIDKLDSKIVIVSQGEKGFREVYLHEDGMQKIIGIEQKMFISKAMFVDADTIVFALLSNELFLYDLKTQKTLWSIAVSSSKFSDFTLDEKRTQAIVADESGDLKIVNLQSAMITDTLKGQNLDNVFQIDTKNQKILTAGQDRRAVLYDVSQPAKTYYMLSSFLIYAVGLSPSGALGAYSGDEQNNVVLFDTRTQNKLYRLTDNKMTLSKILFINENEIFVSSDSSIFNYYNLKGEEK